MHMTSRGYHNRFSLPITYPAPTLKIHGSDSRVTDCDKMQALELIKRAFAKISVQQY